MSPELDDLELSERQGAAPTGRCPSAALMGADVVDRVGPFREDIGTGEFVDWYDRALAVGCQVDHVDETLVRRRIHATNSGRGDRSQWPGVVKAMLDRRRASEGGES